VRKCWSASQTPSRPHHSLHTTGLPSFSFSLNREWSCPPSITAIHSPSPPHHSTSSQLSPTSKRRVHYHIDASGKHLIVRDLTSCRQIHFSPFFAMNSTVTTILVDSSSLVSYSPFPHIYEELHSVMQLTDHLFVLSGSGTVIGAAVRRCFEGHCRQHCRSRPCLLFIQY
jgi:hypothetical protein